MPSPIPSPQSPPPDYTELALEMPEHLPPLPAAIEVAIYRIAQEALTNVAKHARARHCRVAIVLRDDVLELTVADDGRGIAADHTIGVGTHSMAERAAELGGVCDAAPAPGGGTRVSARIPLPRAVPEARGMP